MSPYFGTKAQKILWLKDAALSQSRQELPFSLMQGSRFTDCWCSKLATEFGRTLIQVSTQGLFLRIVQKPIRQKFFVKVRHVFGIERMVVYSNKRDKGVDKQPSTAKKLFKKLRKFLLTSIEEMKSTITKGSNFSEWNEQLIKTWKCWNFFKANQQLSPFAKKFQHVRHFAAPGNQYKSVDWAWPVVIVACKGPVNIQKTNVEKTISRYPNT